MPDAHPLATVVVVNWNGAHLLGPCLSALATQQTTFDFQTWVVDNGSSDGSLALLARDHPEVRVLRNQANLGFAGGNNTALREVTTRYAVLLNNDAVPEPDWLATLLAPFDAPGGELLAAVTSKVLFTGGWLPLRLRAAERRFAGDPRRLGVRVSAVEVDGEDVTGRVLWEQLTWRPEADRTVWTRPEGELLLPVTGAGPWTVTLRWSDGEHVQLSWESGEAALRSGEPVTVSGSAVDVVNNAGSQVLSSGYGVDRGYQQIDDGSLDLPEEVFALCGCAVALRTEAGHALGWFDDDFFLYYEDTDLSWRLRAAGWTIRYEPRAVVRHLHSASTVEWSPTFVFHTERNRLLMLVKNATAARTARAVLRYPLTTGSMGLRAAREAARTRSVLPLRDTRLRLRVLMSFLRLLPAALAHRRSGPSTVDRRTLESSLESRAA